MNGIYGTDIHKRFEVSGADCDVFEVWPVGNYVCSQKEPSQFDSVDQSPLPVDLESMGDDVFILCSDWNILHICHCYHPYAA